MQVPGFKGVAPKQVGVELYKAFTRNAITNSAAQLSYYLLFSMFPFIVFLVTLTAYLPLQTSANDLMARLAAVMPHEALKIVQDQLTAVLSKPKPHLLGIGVLVTLYSAASGVGAFRQSLNVAYDVHESRPFWKTYGADFFVTICGSLLVLVGLAMIALGGKAGFWLTNHFGVGQQFVEVWNWLRWPATMLIIMLVAALAYYALPDVEQRFRYITPGSVIATVLWLVATWGFSFYAEHFGNYDATYGSLGGVILLMTWLYISGLIFLVGGLLNATIEHLSDEGKAKGAHLIGERPPPKSMRPSAAPAGAAKSADVAADTHAENRRSGSEPPPKPATNAPFFRFWKRPRPLPPTHDGDPNKVH